MRRRGLINLGGMRFGDVPPSLWLMIVGALVAGVAVGARTDGARAELRMWTFAALHAQMYESILEDASDEGREVAAEGLELSVLSLPALERRMMSGFLAETGVADLIEVERAVVGRAFLGPQETIGFVDLRPLLERDGLLDGIHREAFSAWSYRDGIYGLPHDVHPVMLMYRSDIVEAAGIDVGRVETWDDFERVLGPLMADADGDGRPDRALLGLSLVDKDKVELLMLQAGGGYFAPDGSPTVASVPNARVAARLVRWCTGEGSIAEDIPDFSASGNRRKIRGDAVAFFAPDWMCSIVRVEMEPLRGKVKLMPLPAWDEGGRRTSVWGGTMLGIARTTPDVEKAWEVAKEIYLSEALVERLYREIDVVTPVKRYWDTPLYDEPDPFFGGQAKGRMFVELIPEIPARVSSPYHRLAQNEVELALLELQSRFRSDPSLSDEAMEAMAFELLERGEARVVRDMSRNVFARVDTEADAGVEE